MTIDTLSIARDLRAAELPPEQAEAIAAAIGRSVTESTATKSDVSLVRADLEVVRAGVEFKIEQVRTELERLRSNLLTTVIGTQIAIAGVIIAVIKL